MAYSNLGITEATPQDPAQTGIWAATVNTNMTLLDNAIAGVLSLSVAGSANVVLTSTAGAANQFRNNVFVFSGVLTGNINVLWPAGVTCEFSVINSTTGAFTLSLGANNGSSAPAGTVYALPTGGTGTFYSDGTNVAVLSLGAVGGTWTPVDASGASLAFTSPVGLWRLSAGVMTAWARLTYPSTASGLSAELGGLPLTSFSGAVSQYIGTVLFGGGGGNPGGGANYTLVQPPGSTNLLFTRDGGIVLTNSNLTTFGVVLTISYPV